MSYATLHYKLNHLRYYMRRLALALGFFLLVGGGIYELGESLHAATCSPSGQCNACKNCSSCGNCAKRGGTCSVCRLKTTTK